MIYKFLKSTFFIVLFSVASCGNTSSQEQKSTAEDKDDLTASAEQKLVLGAERPAVFLPYFKDKKVGVVGNQTSIITSEKGNVHLVDTLLKLGVNVVKVFAPEHGFRGTADAGEKVEDGIDSKTGLPIISLYGNNKKPSAEQLKNIDVLVFDIQDVGARFYTYISTLHYVMEAAAENGIPVVVMDRPNPNGHYIDGPILETEHQSFVGMHPVPVVHGMTIGEYAGMINGEKWLKNGMQTDLTVVEMENYDHNLKYDLPVKPSPNLPNAKAINLYPSLCFFEGTNVNAGRGTNKQFQVFGSPYLPKEKYEFSYVPTSNEGAKNPKHLGKTCYGKDLTTATYLNNLNLEWLINAYHNTSQKGEFFNDFFTKLAGTKKLQQQIEAGMTAEEIRETWQEGLQSYSERRKEYLLYE